MNSFSRVCLCLVALLYMSLLGHQTRADLITDACGNPSVQYKDLCEKTLRADPAAQSADINRLIKITLEAALSDVKAVQSRIAELLQAPSDENAQKALKDCEALYTGAASMIAGCFYVLERRRFADVNAYASTAMARAVTCEGGFKPSLSALTQENQNFAHLCSNVVALSMQGRTANALLHRP